MRAYDNVITMINQGLTAAQGAKKPVLHAVMVDNFVYRASKGMLNKQEVHQELEIDHPVTYGIVLAKNSTKLEKCFRRFMSHNPHTVFEVISQTLAPMSSSWKQLFRQTLESAMVEEVLYEDDLFKTLLFGMLGLFLLALCAGACRELMKKENTVEFLLSPRGMLRSLVRGIFGKGR